MSNVVFHPRAHRREMSAGERSRSAVAVKLAHSLVDLESALANLRCVAVSADRRGWYEEILEQLAELVEQGRALQENAPPPVDEVLRHRDRLDRLRAEVDRFFAVLRAGSR